MLRGLPKVVMELLDLRIVQKVSIFVLFCKTSKHEHAVLDIRSNEALLVH